MAVCSSQNYHASKRAHIRYILSEHEKNKDAVANMHFTVSPKSEPQGQPYLLIFGKRLWLKDSEVAIAKEAGYNVLYQN